MAVYQNRPKMSGDTTVWRYLSLRALLHTLRERRLRFTRIDTFDDPFEGSIPDQESKDVVPMLASSNVYNQMVQISPMASIHDFGKRPEDNLSRLTRLRRAKTRSAHASCWAAGGDTEPPWRMYCVEDGLPRGTGVAMKTTLQRLEDSLARYPDVVVSPVNYRDYQEPGFRFNCELDAMMHKRIGFQPEHEVRALKWDQDHYSKLALAAVAPSELSEHLYVEWFAADVVSTIVVSPYADEIFEETVRFQVSKIDKGLGDRIELSGLHARRTPARF